MYRTLHTIQRCSISSRPLLSSHLPKFFSPTTYPSLPFTLPSHSISPTTTTTTTILSTTHTRSFFWKKSTTPPPSTATLPAVATVVAEREDALPPSPLPIQEEDPSLKSSRLGWSGFTTMFDHVLFSWPRIKTYMVWVGVGVGVLFVIKGGLGIVDFFATLNFLDVGEVAFLAGLLTGIGTVVCGWLGTRFLRLRPEPIFQQALKRLSTDSTVINYLGNNIESGSFRAYSFLNGNLRLTTKQKINNTNLNGIYKYWQPRRLQLFFQISGNKGIVGMASAEVEKNWRGDHKFNLLSVDLDSNTGGERIVLEGPLDYRIYKGIIKLR
jgi:hypothetical protein